MKKKLKMTMSVNDENSAGAANNNNCSKGEKISKANDFILNFHRN